MLHHTTESSVATTIRRWSRRWSLQLTKSKCEVELCAMSTWFHITTEINISFSVYCTIKNENCKSRCASRQRLSPYSKRYTYFCLSYDEWLTTESRKYIAAYFYFNLWPCKILYLSSAILSFNIQIFMFPDCIKIGKKSCENFYNEFLVF